MENAKRKNRPQDPIKPLKISQQPIKGVQSISLDEKEAAIEKDGQKEKKKEKKKKEEFQIFSLLKNLTVGNQTYTLTNVNTSDFWLTET